MIHHQDTTVTVHHGDCLDVLRDLPECSVDAVVTDPPYGLGFMGKAWDSLPPGLPFAQECLRVLKPGGHLLAFGGTRTWHRLAVAVEDAGFELRDSIAWLYGSGFPKSLDVSKAIDKAAGAEREVVGPSARHGGGVVGAGSSYEVSPVVPMITAPATPEAQQWAGWGTALKPAFEPIVVARKPLAKGMTVAANVLANGTGALNIGACRIEGPPRPVMVRTATEVAASSMAGISTGATASGETTTAGRWPANVVLDESQAGELDQQSGTLNSGKMQPTHTTAGASGRPSAYGKDREGGYTTMETYGDSGGASRFFYTAKAGADERIRHDGIAHPTVKPLALMRWLVRLVTPPGGTVLEPFAGSGTTVEACILEGFRCIAIEREADYLPLITQRIHRRRDPVAYLTAAGDELGLLGPL